MKKIKKALLLSTILLGMNMSYAQNMRIGNTNTGITASGNTLSISNGSKSLQLNNIPAIFQGGVNAAKELSTNTQVDSSNISADNLEKLEAAKNNFIKQREESQKAIVKNTNLIQEPTVTQEKMNVGQDLKAIKSTIKTNNISFYNKSTLDEFEEKALLNQKIYSEFPEHIIKNY